jgi:hypothetical protein
MQKKKISKAWTTVTPLSKALALLLFIALPFIGFYLGMEYQKRISPQLIKSNTDVPSHTISPTASPNTP